MAVKSLTDVLGKLKTLITNDMILTPVCTRLMLRTGVNLKTPRPDQVGDGAVVGKVVSTLNEMGYPVNK